MTNPGDYQPKLHLKFKRNQGILIPVGKKVLPMRITAKGQVTIPQDIRERTGLMPGTDVAFEVEAGFVRLVKTTGSVGRKTRGEKLVESLRAHGDFKMSTGEVVALMRGPPADEG